MEQEWGIRDGGSLESGRGFQYYTLRGLGNPDRESFDTAIKQLKDFIAYATDTYPIDVSKRYILGFSQGAILAMTLAMTLGDGLKGIIALNGYVPEFVKHEYTLRPLSGTSLFISHGEMDQVFPVRIAYETESYFRPIAPNLTFRIYPAGHGVTEENRQDIAAWLEQEISIKPIEE
ncbi:MAG: esterase [Paenibacillaceae bacterium]|nr:esterase [Paenibacillaceae bacterium]